MSTPVLNRRLTLETPQDVPDGAGGVSRVWVPMGELWAAARAGSGSETQSGIAPLSVSSQTFLVRGAPFGAPSRPRPDQRFRDGARIFRIISVVEHDSRGHFLSCLTKEEIVV